MNKKTVPIRQCVGCGDKKNKNELIRVIRTPEDEIEIDATGRKNGRGAYLCRDQKCLVMAQKKKSLERSFARMISAELYEKLKKELADLDGK